MTESSWLDLLKDVKALECNKAPHIRLCHDRFFMHKAGIMRNSGSRNSRHCYSRGSFGVASIGKFSYPIEASVDLHGCCLESSYRILLDSVIDLCVIGGRCLLVITGFGGGEGVICKNLLQWINCQPFSGVVLYCTQASKVHGGNGAFYLVLKRKHGVLSMNK